MRAFEGEDDVTEGPLEFLIAEKKLSPHACDLERWVAEAETDSECADAEI